MPGVDANYSEKVDKVLTLNLGDLRYDVQKEKMKHGVRKPVS